MMENKRIVFTKPCVAELLPMEMPQPKAGEVRIKLAVSAISSGTERANLIGDPVVSFLEYNDKAIFPRYVGYSSSGVVDALGDGVTELAVGDRVALSWSKHQQYICIPARNAYRIDDDISFEEAALYHIGTFPMAAIRKCRLEIGESAIVMGLGVLGRFAVQLLRAAGAVPVVAVDPVPEKRQQALAFGADYAFDPFDPDFAGKVKEVTGGGANVAIEVTGNGKALDQVLDCMAQFGRVALLGCTRQFDFTIDYYRKVHGPGVSLIGAHTLARPEVESSPGLWTCRDDALALIRMTRYGRLHLGEMVEEMHRPEEAGEVFGRLAAEKAFPLVEFDWRE